MMITKKIGERTCGGDYSMPIWIDCFGGKLRIRFTGGGELQKEIFEKTKKLFYFESHAFKGNNYTNLLFTDYSFEAVKDLLFELDKKKIITLKNATKILEDLKCSLILNNLKVMRKNNDK